MAEPIEGRKAPTHTLTGPTDTQPSTCRKTQYFTTRLTTNNQEITPNDICESNNVYNLTMHTIQVKHPHQCLTHAEFPDFSKWHRAMQAETSRDGSWNGG